MYEYMRSMGKKDIACCIKSTLLNSAQVPRCVCYSTGAKKKIEKCSKLVTQGLVKSVVKSVAIFDSFCSLPMLDGKSSPTLIGAEHQKATRANAGSSIPGSTGPQSIRHSLEACTDFRGRLRLIRRAETFTEGNGFLGNSHQNDSKCMMCDTYAFHLFPL